MIAFFLNCGHEYIPSLPAGLRQAASIKEQIEKLQKELASIIGTAAPVATALDGVRQQRRISAAAKKKLSQFQKARWAKIKGAGPSAKSAPKRKFTMSAAAKAAISSAAKRPLGQDEGSAEEIACRWARLRPLEGKVSHRQASRALKLA